MRSMLAVVVLAGAPAFAQTPIVVSDRGPTFDRWNYPFNMTPGSRTFGSTFSPGFTPGLFDDRDGQVLVSYATAGDIVPGLGSGNYEVLSARVTATIAAESTLAFAYDPTYDSFSTHLLPSDPAFAPDQDAGRPVELFGTGFRNGFNAFAYGETGPWGFGDPTSEGIRNAFALGSTPSGLGDVSNNVRDRFDTTPFAVGQSTKSAGDLIVAGDELVFDLDLSNPDVLSYIQQSLNAGILSLTISSLHFATQTGAGDFPLIGLKESSTTSAVTLDLSVRIIPAPASAALVAFAACGMARRRR